MSSHIAETIFIKLAFYWKALIFTFTLTVNMGSRIPYLVRAKKQCCKRESLTLRFHPWNGQRLLGLKSILILRAHLRL